MTSSFRPLTGMVQHHRLHQNLMNCFRPLTGMVLSNGADFFCAILFSPPYGDGIGSEGVYYEDQ